MPDSFADRRHSDRGRLRSLGRTECRKIPSADAPNLAVLTVDLCENGVRLVTRELLKPGQDVEIQLCGAGMIKPVRRLGRIIWSRPYQLAELVSRTSAMEVAGLAGIAFDRAVPLAKISRLVLSQDVSTGQQPILLTIFRPNFDHWAISDCEERAAR